jgi:hypothetical protein
MQQKGNTDSRKRAPEVYRLTLDGRLVNESNDGFSRTQKNRGDTVAQAMLTFLAFAI